MNALDESLAWKALEASDAAAEKFYKPSFSRTSFERRQAVLDAAIEKFADQGYNATNINDIARDSGISIGAMYSYFSSKQDLFLTVIDYAYNVMEESLTEVYRESADVFDYVERMLGKCREYGQNHASLNRLYLTITTQPLADMSVRLSEKIEATTPGILVGLIRDGKDAGIVNPDVDEQVYALCIDNIFMMYQFSFASRYFDERLQVYLGKERAADAPGLEQGIREFVRAALHG